MRCKLALLFLELCILTNFNVFERTFKRLKVFEYSPTKMSSTSQKHRNFIAEPMGEKPVSELAGVGEVLGKRLTTAGFDKAYVVLGQFLVLKKNQELFQEWMKDTCSANSKQSSDCYQCLNDWCEEFL